MACQSISRWSDRYPEIDITHNMYDIKSQLQLVSLLFLLNSRTHASFIIFLCENIINFVYHLPMKIVPCLCHNLYNLCSGDNDDSQRVLMTNDFGGWKNTRGGKRRRRRRRRAVINLNISAFDRGDGKLMDKLCSG